MIEVLVSIQMTTNRPAQFVEFLDRLQRVTAQPAAIEIVVKTDDGDQATATVVQREALARPFRIKNLSTPAPRDFYSLWESFDAIYRASDPNAYFFVNLNDAMYFETSGWDDILRRYVGLFPDHIFRLRTSKQRDRNYYDYWEAGFANETSAFMTRRWMDICEGWSPCNGPDTFQQCVAFYFGWLHRFRSDREIRELAVHEINLGGSGTKFGMNLQGRHLRRRIAGSIKPYFILMSHRMQQAAARRAQKLHAHIWGGRNASAGYEVRDDSRRKVIHVLSPDGVVRHQLNYGLSRTRIGLLNFFRGMVFPQYGYIGDAPPWGRLQSFFVHLCFRFEPLGRLLDILWFERDAANPSLRRTLALFVLLAPGRAWRLVKRLVHSR